MMSLLSDAAKQMRKNATDAEKLLWRHLRAKQVDNFKFRRQEQIGRYIVDFVCYEKQLVIEADGGQHAVEKEKDEVRTAWLNSQGFHVLRFWNNMILTNPKGVIEEIERYLLTPSPWPSPTGGEGKKASETQ